MEIPNVTDFKKPVHQFFDLLHPYSYSPTTLQNIVKASGAKIIAWNKDKPYRLQVLVAPTNDTNPAINESIFQDKNIVAKTKHFIAKRRILDKLYKIFK